MPNSTNRGMRSAMKLPNALWFGPSGGKSDAARSFLMVPRPSFDVLVKLLELLRRSFFGPSGGKSDVLNPFLMVPTSSFDKQMKFLKLLPKLIFLSFLSDSI